MGLLVRGHAAAGIATALLKLAMRSTFLQKVMICMIAGFFAACLIQWGKVFVEGADDSLNAGYRKEDVSAVGR